MRFRWFVLLLALVTGLAFAACSDDSGGGPTDVALERGDFGTNDTLVDQGPQLDQSLSDRATPDQPNGQACGDVTYQGSCDGDTVSYCSCSTPTDDAQCRATGTLVVGDCTEFYQAPITGVCLFVDPAWGNDCGVSVGDPCVLSDGQGGISVEFCDGTQPACVISPDASACVENVGTCVAGTSFTDSCEGDLLVIDCGIVQPIGFDCTAYGGTCDADDVICTDVTAGMPCGPTDGALFECAAGLDCVGATDEDLGECQGGGGDAGGDADDAGGDADGDASDDTGGDADDAGDTETGD